MILAHADGMRKRIVPGLKADRLSGRALVSGRTISGGRSRSRSCGAATGRALALVWRWCTGLALRRWRALACDALAGAGVRVPSGPIGRARTRAGGRAGARFDAMGGGSHLRISPPAPDPTPRVPYPLAYIYARVPSGYLAGCARSVWQVAEGTLWDPASKATSAPVVKQQTTGCTRPPGRLILHTL